MSARRAQRGQTSHSPQNAVMSDSPTPQGSAAAGQTSAASPEQSLGTEETLVTVPGLSQDDPIASEAAAGQPQMPVRRIPFGSVEQRLHLDPRPGYRRHWFNDTPGRIQRAEQAGYAFVLNPRTGKPESRPAGVAPGGGPLMAFAMEIPVELFNEDVIREQRKVDEIHQTILEGKFATQETATRYVPKSGIKLEEGH